MSNIYSIANNRVLEPKKTNLWTVVFDAVPNNNDDVIDNLAIDLISSSRPQYAYNVITMERLNMKYKVAGKPNMDATWEIVFRDTIQLNLGKTFYLWNKLIFNRKNGSMGYAAAYKTDATLYLFDPRGDVIEKWIYTGVFPSSTNWNSLSYSESADAKVNITFTYDNVWLDETLKLPDYPLVAVNADKKFGSVSADTDINLT